MPVGEMLQRMPSREISEWIALYSLEHEERLRADAERSARGANSRGRRRGG